MHKPRLVVRLTVALLTFILGVACTLLYNYLRPAPGVSQPAPYTIIRGELRAAPPAQTPCGMHDAAVRHAFVWTPDAPPPPPSPRVRD